jgi:hypothetical protein
VVYTCGPSYSGDRDRRVSWAQEINTSLANTVKPQLKNKNEDSDHKTLERMGWHFCSYATQPLYASSM